jgi:hypothetical protein
MLSFHTSTFGVSMLNAARLRSMMRPISKSDAARNGKSLSGSAISGPNVSIYVHESVTHQNNNNIIIIIIIKLTSTSTK